MALLAFCLAGTDALSAGGGDFLAGADALLAEAKLGRLTSTFAAARAGESFVERAGEGFATFAGDLVLGAATLLDAFDTPLLFGGDLCVERAAAREGPLLFRLLLLTCADQWMFNYL